MNGNNYFFTDDSIEWADLGGGVKRKIFGYDDNLMMVKVSFATGSVGYEHKHPHSQTTFVSKGVFEVTINGQKSVLKQGDSFFVNSDLLHGVVAIEEGELIDIFSPKRDDFLA